MNTIGKIMARHPARTTHTLTPQEADELRLIPPFPEFAWTFWRKVSAARGLDARSAIGGDRGTFSALPAGHGRHWCWPVQLTCSAPPPAAMYSAR